MNTSKDRLNRTVIVNETRVGTHEVVPAHATRREAALERGATRIVSRAGQAGVTVSYLGMAPLPAEPRAYSGPRTDWVLSPARRLSDAIIPQHQRQALRLLLDRAGIDFPLVYVAHEIPKGRLVFPASSGEARGYQPVVIDDATVARVVGSVPLHPETVAVAERLGRRSQLLIGVLSKALPVAGVVVAAPFVLAGAALGALAAGLDPIVFGVIPAGRPVDGQPAAWYALASWDWPYLPQGTEGG